MTLKIPYTIGQSHQSHEIGHQTRWSNLEKFLPLEPALLGGNLLNMTSVRNIPNAFTNTCVNVDFKDTPEEFAQPKQEPNSFYQYLTPNNQLTYIHTVATYIHKKIFKHVGPNIFR
jgi:hypothetical protein